jgi:hypothetical protein
MSSKLEEIFDHFQDKDVSISVGKKTISEKLMSKETFVKIVSRIVKEKSNGEKFTNIDEIQEYLEV